MTFAVVDFRDLDKWSIPKTLRLVSALPDGWHWAKIETFVSQVTDKVKVENETEYKMIGVKWYAEGTFHRETVKGNTISAKYLTPIKAGAFIYNRLFAWKYSFAVVPDEHDGFFVSNEFPQFIVDETKILAKYLYLIFRLGTTIQVVLSASVGSAAVSRNRFKEEEFLEFEIPLPPLDVQRAIVVRWQSAQDESVLAKNSAIKLETQAKQEILDALGINIAQSNSIPKQFSMHWKNVERWSIEFVKRKAQSKNIDFGKYPTLSLSELCKSQSGGTPSKRESHYWSGNIPWVSPKDMKSWEIFDTQDHISKNAIETSSAPLILKDSILVVVRSGILQRTIPIALNRVEVSINQDMRAITLIDDRVIPDYLALYLEARESELLKLVKWSSTVQSINATSLDSFPVSIPPLEIQNKIVSRAYEHRAEIARQRDRAKEIREQAEKEVEMLILGTKKL